MTLGRGIPYLHKAKSPAIIPDGIRFEAALYNRYGFGKPRIISIFSEQGIKVLSIGVFGLYEGESEKPQQGQKHGIEFIHSSPFHKGP